MSFVDACALTDLGSDALRVALERPGQTPAELAIVKVGEDIFAITDECSHAQIKLSEGEVEGCTIECWRHGARFDLRNGEALDLPATEPVAVFPTRVTDGRVLVDLDNPITTNENDSAAAAAADKEN
ncbi:non-heme iron oxygenase ferredoxin subunit [Luteococcus sp. Sow4_B9]|uniref:non-heme iron oxygenase ferredoxin subunit n=1 Tax=Luteococcus sp. Sow4_B9 TaxID=3438792 RepID=UPI003F998528